jgi:vacuolar iron transporter family protein
MTDSDAVADAPRSDGSASAAAMSTAPVSTTPVGTTPANSTRAKEPQSIPPDHHRDVNGGWLRPAVFGVTDGLVSNFSLISGMVGGNASQKTVVLTGLAGLIAGACSMAAGEYVSVTSQAELTKAEIELERKELARHPVAEMQELADSFIERGLDPELAKEVARQIHRDPDQALVAHVQEELGVDPADLPSAVVAAVSSFGAFATGAFLPLLPYLLGAHILWPALILALGGLFLCGAVVSRVTARTWWYSGMRQLFFGAVAAAVTYGLGVLIGGHLA